MDIFIILTIVSEAGMSSQESPELIKYTSYSALICSVLLVADVVASFLQVRMRLCRFSRVIFTNRG